MATNPRISKTLSLPDTTDRFGGLGNPPDGYTLVFSGADGYWLPKPHINILATSNPGSSPYTVTTEEVVLVPSHVGTFTVNLPVGATTGTAIYVKDFAGTATGNPINVASAALIDGLNPYPITTNFSAIRVIWTGSTWSVLDKF